MNKKTKLVYGVGINDAGHEVTKMEKVNGKWKVAWKCPYYTKWKSMLGRCYSKKYQEKQSTYKNCIVCEEWLYFSKFKDWMEQQDWEGRSLDKDFLVEGYKVYSPSSCTFLPQKLNNFIITAGAVRGEYPLGVHCKKKPENMVKEFINPYRSRRISRTGESAHLVYYSTPEEAHVVYLKAKLEQCESYLVEFKEEPLIVKGLTRIKNKIEYHIDNNLELTSF